MKKIKQEVVVTFKNLEFSDKVVLLPIMSLLMDAAKDNRPIMMQVQGKSVFEIDSESVRRAVIVLSELGFRNSRGEGYEDLPAIKEKKEDSVEDK